MTAIFLFGDVQTDCRSKYPAQTSIGYFQENYFKLFEKSEMGKNYTVNDRYKWVVYYKYKVPCGTRAYIPFWPIMNGVDAPEKSWPWQVMIYNSFGFCGGVLIDAQWVLTAAHCIGSEQNTVYFGAIHKDFRDYVESRTTTLLVVHEDYGPFNSVNDIALLKLNSPVEFNDKVRPACLPVDGQDFSFNDRCYITGYGQNNRPGVNVLQQLKVNVIPDRECAYVMRTYRSTVDWRELCVGRNLMSGGACFGDLGGPLSCEIVTKFYVVGIAVSVPLNCTSYEHPDKYLKIYEYINWIFHTVEKFQDN